MSRSKMPAFEQRDATAWKRDAGSPLANNARKAKQTAIGGNYFTTLNGMMNRILYSRHDVMFA